MNKFFLFSLACFFSFTSLFGNDDPLSKSKKDVTKVHTKDGQPKPIFSQPLPKTIPYLSLLEDVSATKAYRYDSSSHAFLPLERSSVSFSSFDPVRFSLTANKEEIQVGQEIVLTITAELLDVSPSLMFTFDGSTSYGLKMVIPQGFVQTGGTYSDFMTGKVSKQNPVQRYELRGFFEYPPENPCFLLLRSYSGAGVQDDWAKKGEICLHAPFFSFLQGESHPTRSARTAAVEEDCPPPTAPVDKNCERRFVSEDFNTYTEAKVGFAPCGWRIFGATPDLQKCDSISVAGDLKAIIPRSKDKGMVIGLFYSVGSYGNVSEAIYRNYNHFVPNQVYVCKFEATLLKIIKEGTNFEDVNVVVSLNGVDSTITLKKVNGEFNEYSFTFTLKTNNLSVVLSTKAVGENGRSYVLIDDFRIFQKDLLVPPQAPILSTPKTVVAPNELAKITATGCLGDKILWYKNGTLLNEANNAGNILFVHPSTATGNYTATCSSSCGTSGFSNLISLSNSAVYIESNKPVSEVYPNEEFVLTAHGCAANWYVEWELPSRFTPRSNYITNPLPLSGPGLYRARCVNSYNANETTPWASIVLLERPMNKPHLVADPGCVYDNQQKTLVASGCGGLPIEWFDGVRQGNPSSRNLNPGIYSARCYSSSSTGTSYGPWEFYEICRIDPNPVVITANKTSVNPLELFELTGSNCVSGGVQWLTPAGEYVWGNTLTAAGPGIYRARCVVSDRSIGAWTSFTMTAKPPGLLTITSNKSRARSNEPVTLTATGCSNGHVMWSYVPNGKTTEVLERGQSITAFGYGTYYAWCVSLGMSGTRADYTVSELTGNIPSVTTDKQMAAPNDPVFVSMSGCSNPEWYWLKVTLPDGRVVYPTTNNGKSVVYGSFTYEAACVNYGGGIDGKTTGSVGLSLVDHLRVVPNKSRVGANESVLVTAYGCDFGKLEWRIGGEIQPAFSGQTSITQVGPGNYYARCRGDLFKSDDWVLAIVNPATDIIPSISSPLRICPNTPTTLSASNCPAGWLYQWFTVERGWNNFNSSTVIQLPQLVKCRCLKPDYSWWGIEQEVNIDASFPNLFTATSNSPVPLGGELKLTVTDISDPTATYKWTPPPGVTLPTTTTRNLTLPNATTSFGGTYEVEVRSGNCQVTAKTEVAVRACEDLYIKSYVPSTGEQTTQLKRKAGVVPMAYESLELSVETLDGQRLPGAAYSWSGPVGVSLPLDASKPFLTQTNQVGKYKATVSFGEGDVCVLETNLSGKPCQVFTDGDCNNTPVGVNTSAEPNENIRNLAVGDVFNVGDYEVTVTKLTSGSQAQGWTGEGMVDQNLIARIKIPMTVEFKKIKINACYQYYNRGENGAVVHTKVDPSWGSVVDLGTIFSLTNALRTKYNELVDLLNLHDKSADSKAKILKKVAEISALKTKLSSNTGLSESDKTALSTAIDAANTEATCFANNECSLGSALTKIEAVLGLLRKNGSLPLPESSTPLEAMSSISNARASASNPCYDGLLSFASYSGGAKLELAKMHECELGGEGYKLEQLNANSCGDGLFYNGIWGEDSDNKYYTLVTPTETYYVYRKINVSCRQYYAAKKSYWTGPCNLGQGNCGELWTRVGIPYGESTGEKAADAISYGFVGTLASLGLVEVAASGLISEGLAAGNEYLVSNKVEILITFVETLVDCPDCTTAEDFAVQFAGNYAANVALGKFTGAVLSTPIAQKVGRYMYQKFLSAGSAIVNSTKKSLIAITELKNKASGYLDEVWGRVRGEIGKKIVVRSIKFIPTSGVKIISNVNKTTTILGRWTTDMQFIKDEMEILDFNVGTSFGKVLENKGGFNFLNIPRNLADASTDFFNQYNKPWLEVAIQRGDAIILATKPISRGDYIVAGKLQGMFAYELQYLVQKNAKPINLSSAEWIQVKSWFGL